MHTTIMTYLLTNDDDVDDALLSRRAAETRLFTGNGMTSLQEHAATVTVIISLMEGKKRKQSVYGGVGTILIMIIHLVVC